MGSSPACPCCHFFPCSSQPCCLPLFCPQPALTPPLPRIPPCPLPSAGFGLSQRDMQVPGPPRWGAYGAPADQQYQQYMGGPPRQMQQAGVMPAGAVRWRPGTQMVPGGGGMQRPGGMQHFNPAPGPPPGKVSCPLGLAAAPHRAVPLCATPASGGWDVSCRRSQPPVPSPQCAPAHRPACWWPVRPRCRVGGAGSPTARASPAAAAATACTSMAAGRR